LDHRIGFVRPGYDADIVVWDSHPLSIGATPSQVYIDGKATLNPIKVAEASSKMTVDGQHRRSEPKMRTKLATNVREDVCAKIDLGKTVITGITKSFLQPANQAISTSETLTIVLNDGKVVCFDSASNCLSQSEGGNVLNVEDGHVLPGLTAVTSSLGLLEIAAEGATGDGNVNSKLSLSDPENIVFAKYGIHLEGKAFERAKIAGVTRAITAPLGSGFLKGVSVGFKTYGNKTILNGGIFQDDIALHLVLGQASKRKQCF
jgi:imidazolonepropionase-like amidohydrolase